MIRATAIGKWNQKNLAVHSEIKHNIIYRSDVSYCPMMILRTIDTQSILPAKKHELSPILGFNDAHSGAAFSVIIVMITIIVGDR